MSSHTGLPESETTTLASLSESELAIVVKMREGSTAPNPHMEPPPDRGTVCFL